MISRVIADQIKKAAQKMPVVTLTGPRQSGKSTLVQQLFPDYRYLSFEDIETRNFAKEDPKGFLLEFGKSIILDEVQYVPDLLSYIQLEVDKNDKAGSFILTGSQNLLLMQQVSQSLAGRTAIFNLLPFSLEELRPSQYVFERYEDYIVKGFYPRLYDKKLAPSQWLLDYIQTYVERDVRQLINIEDADAFRQFIEICAGRIGNLVNFSEMGNLIGVSYQTIRRWLSILKTSFIIYTLRPYHKNYNKRLVKAPKLFFYDTGLACALMNIQTAEQLNIHFAKGALFENFVANEILKNFLNRGERPNLYFWRSSAGREIDLLIDRGTKIYPLEIKAGRTINTRFFEGLNYFNEVSGNPPERAYLIYGGTERQRRSAAQVVGWDRLNELPF